MPPAGSKYFRRCLAQPVGVRLCSRSCIGGSAHRQLSLVRHEVTGDATRFRLGTRNNRYNPNLWDDFNGSSICNKLFEGFGFVDKDNGSVLLRDALASCPRCCLGVAPDLTGGPRMAIKIRTLAAVIAVCTLVGCKTAHQVRDPEYAQVSQAVHATWRAPLPPEEILNPLAHELAGPQPVEAYIQFALSQNPGIQAARKRVDAAAMRVPQAASLKDPMLDVIGWPFFPNTPQTASGRMTVDMMVSQEVPWFGKLSTRAAATEEAVNAARAQLASAELQTIETVKLAYYDLYFVQQSIRITEQDRRFLADIVDIAESLYRTGKTSQQDVLRLQAELSNVDGELIKMRQMRAAAQAELAEMLHISPETPLSAITDLAAGDLPQDLNRLYEQAIVARPELHAMLSRD